MSTISFQPTYEELKRDDQDAYSQKQPGFSAYLWGIETGSTRRRIAKNRCFQPTYEELKRADRNNTTKDKLCFQPTYEELKLK